MNSAELLGRADKAFARNDNAGGLELLREYTASHPKDAGNWHRRAVIEEQLGDWVQAGECHYQCIQTAPNHSIAYLYAGSWLQQNGDSDAAVASYSLAQETAPLVLELWKNQNESEPTRIKSKQADLLLRQFLSSQHRQLFDQVDSRLMDAIWVQNHDSPLTHVTELYSPDLFHIPALTQRPFFETEEFPWADAIRDQTKTIQDELQHALSEHATKLGQRPYLPENTQTGAPLQHLLGSPNWTAIDLYRDGELNTKIADKFPKTLDAIRSVPTYGLDETPFEVFFSMLQSHKTIGAHFGQSNHSLTVHLGLDTPTGGYLSVANEKRSWKEGELLIFNDGYQHSAHNTTDHQRIVLLFSIWHPSLTDNERTHVQLAFKTRQNWLETRRQKLEKLLAETPS